MALRTASAVVGFAESLETGSARFYEAAAGLFADRADFFRALAGENARNVQAVKRAYYSVISDALETGFSFKNLVSDPYPIETVVSEGATEPEILKIAIANETAVQRFYQQAAECSEALMADLPRAFKRMAKNRDQRKSRLQERLDATGGSK